MKDTIKIKNQVKEYELGIDELEERKEFLHETDEEIKTEIAHYRNFIEDCHDDYHLNLMKMFKK